MLFQKISNILSSVELVVVLIIELLLILVEIMPTNKIHSDQYHSRKSINFVKRYIYLLIVDEIIIVIPKKYNK
jgi:hypothetical protein